MLGAKSATAKRLDAGRALCGGGGGVAARGALIGYISGHGNVQIHCLLSGFNRPSRPQRTWVGSRLSDSNREILGVKERKPL